MIAPVFSAFLGVFSFAILFHAPRRSYLACALCGAVAGYLSERYLVRNLVSALLMSLMCLLFCQLVLFLFKCMVSSIGIQGLLPVLAQVGLSLLLCPPVYLAAWAIRKAGA